MRLIHILIFTATFFCSCKTKYEGKLSTATGVEQIKLIDYHKNSKYLSKGNYSIEVKSNLIEFKNENEEIRIDLPEGLSFSRSFYFLSRQLQQPVDIQGEVFYLRGEPYQTKEQIRCYAEAECKGVKDCEAYYLAERIYREDTKKIELNFFSPNNTQKINKTPLASFTGFGDTKIKKLVEERPLSDCTAQPAKNFRQLATDKKL